MTLAMEPGRLFGRQELLDAVWGEDIIVDERTVDVHISWLRGKFSNAGVPGEMIKTVYGAGYRFQTTPVDEARATAITPFRVAGRGDESLLDEQGG